jgi:hypothetical protein
MVNGQIDDPEMFKIFKTDVENQITEIEREMIKLSQGTYDWLEESSNLIKLCRYSKKLFLGASKEEKLQLLDFVSSNRVLDSK